MLAVYPAKYHDRRGDEDTSISNDGDTLRMMVRGVEFTGSDFETFEPTLPDGEKALETFTLLRYPVDGGMLCDCVIECDIPQIVSVHGELVIAPLRVHLDLGVPVEGGYLSHEKLQIALSLDGRRYTGTGGSGWFEDELLELQATLPESVFMKACINCAFSDYSIYGHGFFGGMICFRNCKEQYLSVKTKREYMTLPCPGGASYVQETYLCQEFERRTPGTGYRG